MNKHILTSLSWFLIPVFFLILTSCSHTAKEPTEKEAQQTIYLSDITPFFNHWNLILGNGANAGHANEVGLGMRNPASFTSTF